MTTVQKIFVGTVIAMMASAVPSHAQKQTDLETIARLCAEETGALEQKLLRCAAYRADRAAFERNIGKTFVAICRDVKRQCGGRHNARMHGLSTGLGCAERDFCWYVRR